MSAFIVTSAHIDVLVLASVQFGLIGQPTRTGLAELGTSLWAENHRSITYLYDEDEQPPPYAGPTAEVVLDPVAVVKAVDCYAYQSCEHPEWEASPSARRCTLLRAKALRGLPVESDGLYGPSENPYPVGYNDAPWGITAVTEACVGSVAPRRSAR